MLADRHLLRPLGYYAKGGLRRRQAWGCSVRRLDKRHMRHRRTAIPVPTTCRSMRAESSAIRSISTIFPYSRVVWQAPEINSGGSCKPLGRSLYRANMGDGPSVSRHYNGRAASWQEIPTRSSSSHVASSGIARQLRANWLRRGARCSSARASRRAPEGIGEELGETRRLARTRRHDGADFDAFVEAAEARFGRVDVLVNNGGCDAASPLAARSATSGSGWSTSTSMASSTASPRSCRGSWLSGAAISSTSPRSRRTW